MANDLTTRNIRIDTFGADVAISPDYVKVNAIIATGYTTAKTVAFIDDDGAEVLRFEVAAGGTSQFTPSQPVQFTNGLNFDESASDFAAGDYIYVFLE